MQLENEDAANFLAGPEGVLDGYLESVVAREIEYRLVVELGFYIPNSKVGNYCELVLSDVQDIEYCFEMGNIAAQIPFVKCIWTSDSQFYLSLDPWLASEPFISEQDAAYFTAKHAKLTVSRRSVPNGATFR